MPRPLNGLRCRVAALAALLTLAAGAAPAVAETDVRALLRRVDELWRGESSRAVMTMEVTTRRYTRTMQMEAWSKGKEYSLIVIREPVKDRGVATLKVEAQIWNYLPKIDRVTKIPPSMMMGSWMGSHFTNDDLVKESLYEEDYDPRLTYDGERDGRGIWEITLDPKPDAPVVWGKVVMEVGQAELLPIRALYYDEMGELVRTMRFEDRRELGGRMVPATLVLQPEDKPDESTVVRYEALEFDIGLTEDFFSLRRLRAAAR